MARPNLGLTSAWLQDHLAVINIPDSEESGLSFRNEYDRLIAMRVLMAQERYQEILPLSARMEETACRTGRFGHVIEMKVLHSVALSHSSKIDQALQVLREALIMSQPEGFRRAFLDEGGTIADLLKQGKLEGAWQEPALSQYVDMLLDSF